MSVHTRFWMAVVVWVGAVTLVHLGLNTQALDFSAAARSSNAQQFRVGFLPVT